MSRKWKFMMSVANVTTVILPEDCKNGSNLVLKSSISTLSKYVVRFTLNTLSDLHYGINLWRYETSKVGRDFLDTLYFERWRFLH